jgi:hypothetical protein
VVAAVVELVGMVPEAAAAVEPVADLQEPEERVFAVIKVVMVMMDLQEVLVLQLLLAVVDAVEMLRLQMVVNVQVLLMVILDQVLEQDLEGLQEMFIITGCLEAAAVVAAVLVLRVVPVVPILTDTVVRVLAVQRVLALPEMDISRGLQQAHAMVL